MGAAPGRRARRADRHRRRLLDGRRRRAARGDRRARAAPRRARDGRRRPRHRRARPGRARRGGRGRPRGRGRRRRRHARQGARLLRRVRVLRPRDGQVPGQHRALADLLHRPAAAGRRRGDGRARAARRAAAAGRAPAGNARLLRDELAREGSTSPAPRRRSCRSSSATPARRWRVRGGARARRLRPGDPAADRAGRHVARCASR